MKIKDKRLFELLKEYLTVYLPFQRIVSPLTVKSYKETLNLYIDFLCFYKKLVAFFLRDLIIMPYLRKIFHKLFLQEYPCYFTSSSLNFAT